MLQLSLFGPVSLRRDGREIRIKSVKLRAILGYIALSEPLQETRERLVGLLWSESGEAQARAVLRQVIRELRDVFVEAGSEGLHVSPHEIGFERGAIDVDVWAVIRAAEAGEVHPLLLERPYLTDDLLTGLDDLDSAFKVWVQAKRHTMCDRLLRALEKRLTGGPCDPQQESSLAEAIINLDPTHEEACRRLMRAHAVSGRTSHALRIYKSLWDLLDDDYGMEPSAATQKLVAEIKMGDHEPLVLTQDVGVENPPSLIPAMPSATPAAAIMAVSRPETRILLSLQTVDIQQVDADKAHLVIGFRQFLIASLVKFREWQVTDMPFPEQPGREQEKAARYVIQMFAYQAEQAVQLTLMLKEVDTGFYIWSDGFELNLDNWFASQRRVIRRVAMALNVHISAERLRRFSEQPDISLGVYDRWLRHQTLVRTFDPQHWDRLREQFTEIIAAAPQFVPAYCGLADIHTIEHIAHPGVLRSREREQKALQLGRKAVELDAADIHAHRCLAWAHVMMKQFAQAELHMQVACELNPNDSWTAISAALLSAFCGNPKTCVRTRPDRPGHDGFAEPHALGLPNRHRVPDRKLCGGDRGRGPGAGRAVGRCGVAHGGTRPTRAHGRGRRRGRAISVPRPRQLVRRRAGKRRGHRPLAAALVSDSPPRRLGTAARRPGPRPFQPAARNTSTPDDGRVQGSATLVDGVFADAPDRKIECFLL